MRQCGKGVRLKGRKKKARCGGFTLIEVLSASLVLLIVMGGVHALVVQAQYLARAAAHRAHALQIVRSNLEALRKQVGYADVALSTGTHTGLVWTCPQIYSIGDTVVYVDYASSYDVTETDLGHGVFYKTIDFTVSWDEAYVGGGTKTHSVDAETVIASSLDR